MKNVLCVGEMLIDFVGVEQRSDLAKATVFHKKPGGAPANVSAVIGKFGGSSSFAGSVGNDPFGLYLKEVLEEHNVNTSSLKILKNESTTLAFVSIDESGERDFYFNRGADKNFKLTSLEITQLLKNEIIHFGAATSFLGGDLENSYLELLKSKNKNHFYSFDPNFREDLWKNNKKNFITKILSALQYVDFAKFSDEEIMMIADKKTVQDAVSIIHSIGVKYVAVTLGKDGTFFSNSTEYFTVPSIKIKPVDTTGAGDTFVGALIYQLSKSDSYKNILDNTEFVKKALLFSNIAAALVCEKYGAISAIPNYIDVTKRVEKVI
jgi:fructokinase